MRVSPGPETTQASWAAHLPALISFFFPPNLFLHIVGLPCRPSRPRLSGKCSGSVTAGPDQRLGAATSGRLPKRAGVGEKPWLALAALPRADPPGGLGWGRSPGSPWQLSLGQAARPRAVRSHRSSSCCAPLVPSGGSCDWCPFKALRG